jgi:hypothetical protein
MHATADNSYAICPRCKWAGKLRQDGTMRKHRESVDMGHFTLAGGLPQQPDGDICPGSGEKPWEPGLPEDYELPKQNKHGGFERPEAQEAKQVPGTLVDPWTWIRRSADPFTTRSPWAQPKAAAPTRPRYVVLELGRDYFAVRDTRTDLDVATNSSRAAADAKAAELNEENN